MEGLKKQLILAAKKTKFKSKILSVDEWIYSDMEDLRYCLWMEELKRWLRRVHLIELPIKSTPSFDIMEPKKWKGKIKYCFSPLRFTNNSIYVADEYEAVLEVMLLDALKLIDVAEERQTQGSPKEESVG